MDKQTAIIDTATRIIKVVTIDPIVTPGEGETAIVLDNPIDLGNGPWKLDDTNTKVVATAKEYQDSGLDEQFNQEVKMTNYLAFKATLASAIKDKTLPVSLIDLLSAMNKAF